jgi:hypothetical protein
MQRNKPNSLVRIQTKEDDARDRANDVNGLTVVTKYSRLKADNQNDGGRIADEEKIGDQSETQAMAQGQSQSQAATILGRRINRWNRAIKKLGDWHGCPTATTKQNKKNRADARNLTTEREGFERQLSQNPIPYVKLNQWPKYSKRPIGCF